MHSPTHSLVPPGWPAARSARLVLILAALVGCAAFSAPAHARRPLGATFHGIVILPPQQLRAPVTGGAQTGKAVIMMCDEAPGDRSMPERVVAPEDCVPLTIRRPRMPLQVRVEGDAEWTGAV